MDRYYTMRPINLSGEVTGYRAELVGVGAGADALRTIMQNAIQKVGVSITPIVCQQLFVEVFNAAVDFACDSGTSVNIADIVSFKWNTRGKYDSIDATVPKSALSLTAVISPKVTRNAVPHFDLKAEPVAPIVTRIDNPFDTLKRGVVLRGLSLAGVEGFQLVNPTTKDPIVTYARRTVDFVISDNGRELTLLDGGLLHQSIAEGTPAAVRFNFESAESPVWVDVATPTISLRARSSDVVILSATPQPYTVGEEEFAVTGHELTGTRNVEFYSLDGVHLLHVGDRNPNEFEVDILLTDTIEKLAPWTGGPTNMVLTDENNREQARFLVNVNAYTL